MTRIGQLRVKLKLQSKSNAKDADGYLDNTDSQYSTDEEVWGRRRDERGVERDETGEGRKVAIHETVWRIRHRTGLSAPDRVVEANSTENVYDVQSIIDPTGRGQWLDLHTLRRGA